MLNALFGYKAWANAELLKALAAIDAGQHPQVWRRAVRILNHTYVVDRIFAAHLLGQAHGHAATNTEQTPALATLADWIADSDRWYVDYVQALDPQRLAERLVFCFTDGKPGAMSRGEILAHLITHGAYHRGQIGTLLVDLSLQPPADTLAGYLHGIDPARRAADPIRKIPA